MRVEENTIPTTDKNQRLKGVLSITLKGLAINLLLVIVKISSGIFGRSGAMIADGIHSLSDSVSDVFLFLGFKIADKPPDKTHKYGHGKFETLLTVIISLMIIFAGALILYRNSSQIYRHLIDSEPLIRPGWIALFAAVLSLIVKEYLYRITKKVGQKYHSNAVIANAWHHRTDALTSIAAFLGIGGAIILNDNWLILDPLTAVLVSVFILFIGFRLIKDSFMELLETSLSEDKEREIIKIVKSVHGVLNPHNLKTRKVGNYIVIDIHIEVNSFLNVIQAHDIATEVEATLQNRFGIDTLVSVHIEPFDFVK
ncbi:MAG: cation diffusion facilitator family transporter [Candidatus Cloacimonetes bacterium]|nr:cation diffusion facilitator family transporter [Candidatus Cloacimonadota bacterium]